MLLACELADGIGVLISALQWAECAQLGFYSMYRGERNLISIPGAYSPEVSTLKFMGKWQHELVDPVPSGLFWNQLIACLRTLLYVGV